MIARSLLLRFDPLTPETHARGDSKYILQTARITFRVCLRIARGEQRLFIAGALPLIHQAVFNPPGRRVKPAHRFHGHMDRRGQVIAAAHVAKFVGENGLPLRWHEMVQHAFGHDEDRKYQTLRVQAAPERTRS
jgi:hypothetical protein